jgi:hypothetical protein
MRMMRIFLLLKPIFIRIIRTIRPIRSDSEGSKMVIF